MANLPDPPAGPGQAGDRSLPDELLGEGEAVSDLLLALAAAPSRDPGSLVPALLGRWEVVRGTGADAHLPGVGHVVAAR